MVVKKKAPVKKKLTVKKKEEKGKSALVKKKPEVYAPALEVRFVMRDASRKSSLEISEAQKFQLDMIARTNFNFCNGKKVVELLKENRRMWRAVLMPLDFISLRDMDDGSWHADTLDIIGNKI